MAERPDGGGGGGHSRSSMLKHNLVSLAFIYGRSASPSQVTAQNYFLFVKARLHGDFCRTTQCNFCRAEVATSKSRV